VVALTFSVTTSPLPAPPRKVVLPMSAVAGHSAAAPAPWAGAPCGPQLEPEHCAGLIGLGLSALPLLQAIKNGLAATANANTRIMACDMRLSPFV
jgi:hypothetical protein